MASIAAMIASGLLVGLTFTAGGTIFQEGEKLLKEGFNFVKGEFANKRKGKLNDNPTTDLDNIKDHLTINQRKLVDQLMKGSEIIK